MTKYFNEEERKAAVKESNKRYYLKTADKRREYSRNYYHAHKNLIKINEIEGEVWKPVIGYENLYECSNLGRIKSLWNGREIDGCYDSDGYRKLTLTDENRNQRTFRRARIIAINWIPNPENKPEVDHIDCDRTNDAVSNLRWVTSEENKANPLTRANMSNAQKNNPKIFGRQK